MLKTDTKTDTIRTLGGNKRRQLRRQETERGRPQDAGEESVVGGVEPKEMDNWINVEASAILSPIRFSPLLVRSAMRYTQ